MGRERGPTIRLSRRAFLERTACGAAGLLLSRCGSPAGGAPRDGGIGGDGTDAVSDATLPVPDDGALLGLLPSKRRPDFAGAVREACGALDWSWLAQGDSVFVKLACNSGLPHPATTSPAAVRAVCEELFSRGAGRVLAGDMGGIEYVRLTSDSRWGSTRDLLDANGLLDAILDTGAEPWVFDDQNYHEGFVEATLDLPDSHWPEPPRIARICREVDHIVVLPRLASHAVTGYTHGLKAAVGWLRDDSRYLLHFLGGSLHAMVAELNHCRELRERVRLVLTAADRVLLDCGPDQGTLAEADPRIVIAARNPAVHDALAVAVLACVDARTPVADDVFIVYSEFADAINQVLINTLVPQKYGEPWGSRDPAGYTAVPFTQYQEGIASDPALTRAFELQGGRPEAIPLHLFGVPPDPDLIAVLEAYDGGIFRLPG
ncbi:MAG: DUF362 domain-containing protein [Deltaproteobacteria bacterium]|nr:DUF362 domain-containing protein [Deltaproteobacteria bacterium]